MKAEPPLSPSRYLLSRARTMLGCVTRDVDARCVQIAVRPGTHNVHQSGKSFYGWALAFSGLAPPPKGRAVDACACDIGAETVSLPWVLRGVPALEAGAT